MRPSRAKRKMLRASKKTTSLQSRWAKHPDAVWLPPCPWRTDVMVGCDKGPQPFTITNLGVYCVRMYNCLSPVRMEIHRNSTTQMLDIEPDDAWYLQMHEGQPVEITFHSADPIFVRFLMFYSEDLCFDQNGPQRGMSHWPPSDHDVMTVAKNAFIDTSLQHDSLNSPENVVYS